ncbi:hypothetical protein DFJ58DRAFT_910646 [Suillus subalutaceus]|uniref:uncharacterized protein n=1 Tax=Suillus subalutaceus TaxID=48586 RepID=UPI001B862BA9|nr:uncharacterized protein DFJ58DRAFT_910646 [Suillus subalutaceus]KAG1872341.1 hypothetical protein DFJ58DRAFT_910646 [Suillus subalutaceus]
MATNNLPVELWLVVFSFTEVLEFSLNDLAALCRVCIGFHHAVVDSLYESITVDKSDVCTTLAERPHLAEKVKSFIFTYPTITGPQKYDLPLDTQAYSFPKHYSSVLRHCDAKLLVFHCTYDVDRQLLSFLNKQDNIRDLAIIGDPILDQDTFFELPEILSPTSLPHLTEISASLSFLRVLVPGRPVQTVRFKSYHAHFQSSKWGLDDIVSHSTVPVRHVGLDLTIWPLSVLHEPRALLPKHVEEITLTGFATGRPFTIGGLRIWDWEYDVHLILASTPSLKRLTFWMEGEREDARVWARLLFQEFHDKLSHLEQVSCVIAGPDMSTSFDFFEEKPGCLLIGPHEDNQTRGHRAANDIRELMPFPIFCCRTGEKDLCDRKVGKTLQLDRRDIETFRPRDG